MSGKQYAIDHMNKDHTLALYDYVNAFTTTKLDFFKHDSTKLTLVDTTKEALFLQYYEDGIVRKIQVPFTPTLKSEAELRPRVIEMAYEAADKLKVAPYQIKHYKHWDNPIDFVIDIGAYFLIFHTATGFQLSKHFSGAWAQHLDKYIKPVLLVTLGLHLVEIALTLIPKLRKYRVPSPAYNKWILATFIAGIFAIKRFDRQVAAKEKGKAQLTETSTASTTGSK